MRNPHAGRSEKITMVQRSAEAWTCLQSEFLSIRSTHLRAAKPLPYFSTFPTPYTITARTHGRLSTIYFPVFNLEDENNRITQNSNENLLEVVGFRKVVGIEQIPNSLNFKNLIFEVVRYHFYLIEKGRASTLQNELVNNAPIFKFVYYSFTSDPIIPLSRIIMNILVKISQYLQIISNQYKYLLNYVMQGSVHIYKISKRKDILQKRSHLEKINSLKNAITFPLEN